MRYKLVDFSNIHSLDKFVALTFGSIAVHNQTNNSCNARGVEMQFDDGIIAVVKKDCPTCILIEPVLKDIEDRGLHITIFFQDESDFLSTSKNIDDTSLEASFFLNIETVPSLIKIEKGEETTRVVGWERVEWQEFFEEQGLGMGLPDWKPGCGSLSVEEGVLERLAVKFGGVDFYSRKLKIPSLVDDIEYCYEQGWTDGLPVIPPTEERVLKMLNASPRLPNEIMGSVPPHSVNCPVVKVAINAVMAGCKPEYFPIVLAAVEAALDDRFCLGGLLATTWFSGPMVVVNGPIREAVDMNWSGNLLGQGNRANATIGRALQLLVRNVGGGHPKGTDQSTFGTPVKYGLCFAEDEETPWTTLAEDQGIARDRSAVTVFSADGPLGCVDQNSRAPEGVVESLAGSLRSINHVEMANASDAVILIGPEHGRVFDLAGWSKADTVSALHENLFIDGADLGMTSDDEPIEDLTQSKNKIPKFREEGLQLIRAGGDAGLFSAIIPGWLMKGELGTDPVTKEI